MSTSACTGNVDMWYGIRGPIRRISNITGLGTYTGVRNFIGPIKNRFGLILG